MNESFTRSRLDLFCVMGEVSSVDKYSGTPPYDHPVYKTTSLLRPYSFKPNVKNIDSFYYFEDPVNATTSLLRPEFYGPTVVVLTGLHCRPYIRRLFLFFSPPISVFISVLQNCSGLAFVFGFSVKFGPTCFPLFSSHRPLVVSSF